MKIRNDIVILRSSSAIEYEKFFSQIGKKTNKTQVSLQFSKSFLEKYFPFFHISHANSTQIFVKKVGI
jgi:hypothetical protein